MPHDCSSKYSTRLDRYETMFFSILLLAVCASFALTQHPDATLNEGAKLFAQNCSACHGDTAKGGRAPDLTSGQWKHGGTDEDLIRNIVKGIPGTQMPAIPLPEADARKIITFLRSLSGKAGADVVTGNLDMGCRARRLPQRHFEYARAAGD